MIKRTEKEWVERIKHLVDNDMVPEKWLSVEMLANWIIQIDPYLLNSTPIRLHQLFGRRKGDGEKAGRWVLSMETAQRLMLDTEWENVKSRKLMATVGDDIKRIGKKSFMMLENKIDEGDMEAVKVGLEISKQWVKGIKTFKGEEERAKVITDLVKKSLGRKDVEKLGENH